MAAKKDLIPYASRPFERVCVQHWIRKQNPKTVYLEIGAFRGGAMRVFGGAMAPGATLIAVDKPIGHAVNAGILRQTIGDLVDKGFDAHVVFGNSRDEEIKKRVADVLDGRKVDVLFIDGDHSKKGVTADVANYVPFVRPGGLVIFHDVGPRLYEPKKAKKNIDAIWPTWFALASKHHRNLSIQEHCGYGLVWLDE